MLHWAGCGEWPSPVVVRLALPACHTYHTVLARCTVGPLAQQQCCPARSMRKSSSRQMAPISLWTWLHDARSSTWNNARSGHEPQSCQVKRISVQYSVSFTPLTLSSCNSLQRKSLWGLRGFHSTFSLSTIILMVSLSPTAVALPLEPHLKPPDFGTYPHFPQNVLQRIPPFLGHGCAPEEKHISTTS